MQVSSGKSSKLLYPNFEKLAFDCFKGVIDWIVATTCTSLKLNPVTLLQCLPTIRSYIAIPELRVSYQ